MTKKCNYLKFNIDRVRVQIFIIKKNSRYTGDFYVFIQGDSDVFSIKQNLNLVSLMHAFFTKVLHFRDNRKNLHF